MRRLGPLALAILLIPACGGESIRRINKASSLEASRETYASLIPQSAPPALNIDSHTDTGAESSDYVLGPEDLIEIAVFELDTLNRYVRITGDGYIGLPLLGDVKAAGLTAKQLEEQLIKLLGAKYLVDPHVSIFIKEYVSQKVFVVGAVKEPGAYPISKRVNRILDFLSAAGGLTETAGFRLYLMHAGLDSDVSAFHVAYQIKTGHGVSQSPPVLIDLRELLEKGNHSFNLAVKQGDVLYVPEALPFFVMGEVGRPGSFLLTRDFSLLEAVSEAGGLAEMALPSRIRVVRKNSSGKKTYSRYSLGKIVNGEVEDPIIFAGDLVVVPRNHVKATIIETMRLVGGVFTAGLAI